MIRDGAAIRIVLVELSAISVTEYQRRYPERAIHYANLMADHPLDHAGLVSLRPLEGGRYELLDGHHRFVAAILVGRPYLLAAVIDESHLN